MITIRLFENEDWPALWAIIKPVFKAGETYPYPTETSEEEAHQIWIEQPSKTYVAIDNTSQKITGTYYLKPNQPGLGAHICNCGYIVGENATGKGIATSLCKHSQKVAINNGYRAMQYNLVVSTNIRAVALWQKLGFETIATIPEAFNHKTKGYVDAHVMYKKLKASKLN